MTLHRELVEPLLRRIQSGELTPGRQLPTEAQLMREHGVSRTTARRALDELVDLGLVRREAGRGTFVAAPSILVHLPYLAGLASAIADGGHSPRARLLLREPQDAGETVAEQLGIGPRDPVLRIRHLCTGGDQPLLISDSRLNLTRFPALEQAHLPGLAVLEAAVAATGGRIDGSRYRVGAQGASGEVAGLLGIRRTAPVLHIERVVHLAGDITLESATLDLHPGRCRCHGDAGTPDAAGAGGPARGA